MPLKNLESIYIYLCEHRPAWAEFTMRKLYDAARSLRTMSDRGRLGAVPGTRELVLTDMPYIIVYRVTHQNVELLHINHAARGRRPN